MSRGAAGRVVLVCALLHLGLSTFVGIAAPGDASLGLGLPLAAVTALAALLLRARRTLADFVAVVLTAAVAGLSALLVGAWFVGLFHLPPALLAVVAVASVRD